MLVELSPRTTTQAVRFQREQHLGAGGISVDNEANRESERAKKTA